MKMNRIWKPFLGLVILAIVFRIGIGLLIEKDSPEPIEVILNNSKNDTVLMKKIGGYNSFKYNFSHTNYERGSPFDFNLTIYGEDSVLIFRGKFVKRNQVWAIEKIDTTFKSY